LGGWNRAVTQAALTMYLVGCYYRLLAD
jgi:hypothetical protein